MSALTRNATNAPRLTAASYDRFAPWAPAVLGGAFLAGAGGTYYLTSKAKYVPPHLKPLKTSQTGVKTNESLWSKIGAKASGLRRLKFWKRDELVSDTQQVVARFVSATDRRERPKVVCMH